MSKSLNENLFSNKIETLPLNNVINSLKCSVINDIDAQKSNDDFSQGKSNPPMGESELEMEMETENLSADDPLQKLKYNLLPPFDHKTDDNGQIITSNLNLSIESDDFEVNPLEKRVPSQDDIDRICRITNDAPISTQGASYKVIESIKEIERNRQLLLTQQGSQVIEHERQKMNELKRKCQNEARAQYQQLQTQNDDSIKW